MTDARPTCRHCLKCVVSKPRGLCWACHRNMSVRELYAVAPHCVHGPGAGSGSGTPPVRPCPHPQGSPGRLDTMSRRAVAGESLWHPGDCREITADVDGRAGHYAA